MAWMDISVLWRSDSVLLDLWLDTVLRCDYRIFLIAAESTASTGPMQFRFDSSLLFVQYRSVDVNCRRGDALVREMRQEALPSSRY